jgi:hypothetical protein
MKPRSDTPSAVQVEARQTSDLVTQGVSVRLRQRPFARCLQYFAQLSLARKHGGALRRCPLEETFSSSPLVDERTSIGI